MFASLSPAFPPFRPQQPLSTSPLPPAQKRGPLSVAVPLATCAKKKVLVPIGMGTEEIEAVVLASVLRLAGADVLMASVESELQVAASSGVGIVADVLVTACAGQVFDLIALPGGMPGSVRLRDCEILRNITTKHAEARRLYGALCAAPAVVLVPWGLHRRKEITCHPAFMDKLPTFRAVKSDVQVSGELTTSRGPGTIFQFALSLVEQLFGSSIAEELPQTLMMLVDNHRQHEEFNETEWSFDHTPRVLVPIANGSEEMEVAMMVDILRRAKADVVVASLERSRQVVGSQEVKIVADKSISDASKSTYDLIILPGGHASSGRLQKSRFLKKLLQEQEEAGRAYGSIGSSLTVLETLGLLKDKAVVNSINGQVSKAGVRIDGKVVTGMGGATAVDLSLAIVGKFFCPARARSVAEGLVYEYSKRRDGVQ